MHLEKCPLVLQKLRCLVEIALANRLESLVAQMRHELKDKRKVIIGQVESFLHLDGRLPERAKHLATS